MKLWCKSLCTLVVLGLCAAAHHSIAAAVKPAAHTGPTYTDANLEQAAVKALRRNPALRLVDASAWHGTITLTGTVDHYQDRADAEAAVRELSGVRSLQTAITVAATPVDDFELQKRLEDRLRFARADMGIMFPQVPSPGGLSIQARCGARCIWTIGPEIRAKAAKVRNRL